MYNRVIVRNTCVLVSGGIESAALVHWALRGGGRVQPVFVRAGHAWEVVELGCLRRLLRALGHRLEPLSVLELPVRDCYRSASWSFSGRRVPSARTPDEAVYLPGRNLLLIAKAAVFCAERRIRRLALGSLGSNPFPDGNPAFFRRMAATASAGLNFRLEVAAPFAGLHKADVIAGVSTLPWGLTFSCIAPRGSRHCGRCNKCAERRTAFRDAGVADPTLYAATARSRAAEAPGPRRGATRARC